MRVPTTQAEIAELQRRLCELQQRSLSLEQRLLQEEQQAEAEELEVSVLRSCSAPQLQDMSRALHDLITSENRTQINVSPSPSMLRLVHARGSFFSQNMFLFSLSRVLSHQKCVFFILVLVH